MSITKEEFDRIGDEAQFLAESNAIENVFDNDSLIQAHYAWKYLKAEKRLDHGVILKTHKILMLHQKLMPDQKGYYRQIEVSIKKNEIIGVEGDELITRWVKVRDLMPHKEVRQALTKWIDRANKTYKKPNPFIGSQIIEDHVTFETIHPFVDGNGRIGRMLMNWQRLHNGLSIVIISADPEEKKKYYEWFK